MKVQFDQEFSVIGHRESDSSTGGWDFVVGKIFRYSKGIDPARAFYFKPKKNSSSFSTLPPNVLRQIADKLDELNS